MPHDRLAAIDLANGHVLGWAPSVDGAVIAIALTATRVYVGGNFTTVGVASRAQPGRRAVATRGAVEGWNPQPNGRVAAIQVSGTGPVFVGGDFTTLGGSVTRTNLAAIDQGSGAPTTWRSDATGGAVHALWLRDATLYVGGEFTSIDGTARNRLAAVEVVDGDALTWNPNVTGTSAVVEEIEIVPGSFDAGVVTPGKLYIGGRFTQIGLLPRGGYAGFNETTEAPSNTVLPAHHRDGAARQLADLLERHLDRVADRLHAAVACAHASTSPARRRRATPCRSPTSARRSSAA